MNRFALRDLGVLQGFSELRLLSDEAFVPDDTSVSVALEELNLFQGAFVLCVTYDGLFR